jgi:hypothetical protein
LKTQNQTIVIIYYKSVSVFDKATEKLERGLSILRLMNREAELNGYKIPAKQVPLRRYTRPFSA